MRNGLSTLLILAATYWAAPSFAQGTFTPAQATVTGRLPRLVSTTNFVFKDLRGRDWTAPPGTVTDGLSIPYILQPFVIPLVGSVWAPEYQGAALVHDAYCAKANEKGTSYAAAAWWDVHRMFFEACLAGKAPLATARTLYAAVLLGGPKLPMREKTGANRLLIDYQKSIQRSEQLATMKGDHTADERQERQEQKRLVEEQAKQLADANSILDWSTEAVADNLKVAQFLELKDYFYSQKAQGITQSKVDSVLRAATTSLQKNQVLSLPE